VTCIFKALILGVNTAFLLALLGGAFVCGFLREGHLRPSLEKVIWDGGKQMTNDGSN